MPREDLYAQMYRVDVDKVRAVKRALTGKTACPNCGKINPADKRTCKACGVRLYPVEEENDRMYLLEKLKGKDE